MAVRLQAGLPLSDRENQVARLVAGGLTNRQIASSLCCRCAPWNATCGPVTARPGRAPGPG